MRAVISRIPDGTYEFEDKIDDDGITDQPIHIHAKVIVAGDEMTVDLSGCSAQSLGPSNATLASTCSDRVLRADGDGRRAGAVQRRLLPPGEDHRAAGLLRERRGAGTGGASHRHRPPAGDGAVRRAAQGGAGAHAGRLLRRLLCRHVPDHRSRSSAARCWSRSRSAAAAALSYSDGASAHSFGMHNNANIPMEMIESDMPLTFLGYGLLTDSGGAGRHRGGLGLWREWRIDCPAAQLSTNLDRFKFRPFGLDGGEPAALSALYLTRDGVRQALPSKVTNLMVRKGDIVRLETSGGGGFGDAAGARPGARRARRAAGLRQRGGGCRGLRVRPTGLSVACAGGTMSRSRVKERVRADRVRDTTSSTQTDIRFSRVTP